MPNPIEELRQRGVVAMDLPTMENYYTGKPLIANAKRPYVLRDDGASRYSRKYMPDSQPSAQNIVCMTRLPSGFGEYANGMAILYMTGSVDGPTDQVTLAVDNTYPPTSYVFADSPRVPTGNIRVAVHKAVDNESDWATGWVPVAGINVPVDPAVYATLDSGSDYYYLSPSENWAVHGVGPEKTPGRAGFIAQRNGDFVLILVSSGGDNSNVRSSQVDYTYRLKTDLSVETIAVDTALHTNLVAWNYNVGVRSATRLVVDEGKDPRIWGAAIGPSGTSTLAGFSMRYADYAANPHIYPSYVFSIDGPVGPLGQGFAAWDLVFPWSNPDGAAPELWALYDNGDGHHTIYRSKWEAGQYNGTYPPNNPRGFAFSPNWERVATFEFPLDFRETTFVVQRDPSMPDVLHMIITQGPDEEVGSIPAAWATQRWGVSFDDGKTWTLRAPVYTWNLEPIRPDHGRPAPHDGLKISGWTSTPRRIPGWNGAFTVTGVPVFGGSDFWTYYHSDGTRVPFWNGTPPDAGVHLAFFYPYGPGGITAAIEDGKDIRFKPSKVLRP